MLRRNGPVKAVESVLRPEGSLWWERFVKKVGLEPGVKERKLWMVRVVDDYEWIKAERRQDPADLAWHSTAARQAHCDSTP